MNFFQLPSSLAFPRAMVAGQQLPRGTKGGRLRRAPSRPPRLPVGVPGLALRRLHPPLPLRLSKCQTRGGGAEAGGGGGGGGGGGERREGPRTLGGSEPRTYWWAHGRSRALFGPPRAPLARGGFGGYTNPQLPLPLPPGTRARPPPPVTSAETGRGQEKVRGKRTDQRAAGLGLWGQPRAEKLAEGACPTFTIYRA